MIRAFKSGSHAHRTPLSYPALSPLWEGRITLVDRPDQADLYLFSHVTDIATTQRDVIDDWRQRKPPVVLLSEEPFWDTIWGKRPTDDRIYVATDFGDLPVIQINHQTSPVFEFDLIPYYLLTNPRFAEMYQRRFLRNAALRPEEWHAAFQERAMNITFMFERRPESFHDVAWPQDEVIGLCRWRTRLAEACQGERIERLGRSWGETDLRRQDLPDWYRDKMDRLDGRTRVMGAIENTHQPDYITEKLFDAFACGAVPLYYASKTHRIHEFGLPAESWINLHGTQPETAADMVMAQASSFILTPETFHAYARAQRVLANLFFNPHNWEHERNRLQTALLNSLEAVLDRGW